MELEKGFTPILCRNSGPERVLEHVFGNPGGVLGVLREGLVTRRRKNAKAAETKPSVNRHRAEPSGPRSSQTRPHCSKSTMFETSLTQSPEGHP